MCCESALSESPTAMPASACTRLALGKGDGMRAASREFKRVIVGFVRGPAESNACIAGGRAITVALKSFCLSRREVCRSASAWLPTPSNELALGEAGGWNDCTRIRFGVLLVDMCRCEEELLSGDGAIAAQRAVWPIRSVGIRVRRICRRIIEWSSASP